MSTNRHDTATAVAGAAGRQDVAGKGRPRGRPPRSSHRALHCAACGELRNPSALLTMDEVALRLGTSVRHIQRLVAERRIPIVKVGRFVRFDAHDVEHWVDDHRVDVMVPAAVAISAARRQRQLERENSHAGETSTTEVR